MSAISKLQYRLGYYFQDEELLLRALTHRSSNHGNYERLEFLGDSILGYVIAEDLFHRFPEAKEGQLSRLRSRIVKKQTLAEVAREFELGDCLIMGSGELKSGGFERDSILSDVLEAIIAGIYLDRGIDAASERISVWFQPRLESLSLSAILKDPKSRLQEYLQARQCALPEYEVTEITGKSHDQIFTVTCRVELIDGLEVAQATSRREAEQIAAARVLDKLEATLGKTK